MILKRLTINRLPGIRKPFEIKPEGPGIHVIFGPNGVGKSSICRAVEVLFWRDRGARRKTSVSSVFEWEGDEWRAEREGPNGHWRRADESNASPNLPPSHNYHCFFLNLRDLVDPAVEGTQDIASEIRRQMSGGFDMHTIGSDLFSPMTRQKKLKKRKDFNAARDRVQREEGKQNALQRRIDRLDALQSRLDSANAAASRLAHVERAIGLASRQQELTVIQQQLGALPDALANLTGQERDDIHKHEKELTRLDEVARKFQRELLEAGEAREESRLAEPLLKADLATWRQDADNLETIERDLEGARKERAKAKERLASSLADVGGADISRAQIGMPDRAKLFELLRDSHSHNTQVQAIKERLGVLKRVDAPRNGEHDMENTSRATDALRSWLRVPQTESPAIRLRNRWPWLMLAFVILLAGTALAYLVHPALALIAIVGPGIALAALFPGGERGLDRQRRHEQERYRGSGLEEPAQWDSSSVEFALRRLESRKSEIEASVVRARDRDVERKPLEQKLEALAEQERDLENRRQNLKATLGLESIPPDAETGRLCAGA